MAKEMLINVSEGEECRIALLDDGRLEELYMERTSATSHVGNIYKGKVTNVEASIQAAFIDFGLGRNGFLHISDLMPTYFGRKGEDIVETVGKNMARRDRPPIQRCLRRGDEIMLQIIKEGIGTKGPTLTSYLSVPGRFMNDIRRRSVFDMMDLPHVAGDNEYLVSLELHESGWRDEAIYGDRAPINFPQDIVHFLDAWNPLKRYAGIK